MLYLIIGGLVVILLWAIFARQLNRWHISGPIVMVIGGTIAGVIAGPELAGSFDSPAGEIVVELILAVLLFVDATEVRGGYFGGEPRTVLRLLLIGLPLSLIFAFFTGLIMLDDVSWAVILLIACTVVPTDFTPAPELLRMKEIPSKVRHILNVESGYNDGFVSPLFVIAAAAAVTMEGSMNSDTAIDEIAKAIEQAFPATLYALILGILVGAVAGYLIRRSVLTNLASPRTIQMAVAILPFIAFVSAKAVEGNGFVAAFVAGIAYRSVRTHNHGQFEEIKESELSVADSVGILSAMVMWFAFGLNVSLILTVPLQWQWVLYPLLALTVLRMVPIYLSLLRSKISWKDRTTIGLLGPRGTASIVFGLLALNELNDDDGGAVLYSMIVVVLISLLLHGLLAPILAKRFLKPVAE